MVAKLLSAEEWIAEVNRIVQAYRSNHAGSQHATRREAALSELKALGLASGDALRYLDAPHPPR